MTNVAYEVILGRILEGSLRANEPISEAQLALEIGLSRTPVREAIGRLEGEELVHRIGRTLVVKSVTVEDYLEVLHMRRLLEAEATAQAIGRIPMSRLQSMLATFEAMDETSITADENQAADELLHQTIAEASRSSLMARTISGLRRKTRLFDFDRIPGRFVLGRSEHIAILQALIDQDQQRAVDAMRRHIDNFKDSILTHLGKLGAAP